jgi:hypothetical protein
VGMSHNCIPQEGGWDKSVGIFSSIRPNSTILNENPLSGKIFSKQVVRQICFNAKTDLATFDQMNSAFLSFNKVGLYPLGTLTDFIIF